MKRLERPALTVVLPGPPTWFDTFRLQVMARSPGLAACFEGSQQPGQLKWTTSIDARGGTVSEHQLEPMLPTGAMTAT